MVFFFAVGRYNVVLDESHFRDILHQLVSPPPATVCSLACIHDLLCSLTAVRSIDMCVRSIAYASLTHTGIESFSFRRYQFLLVVLS